MSIPIDSVDHSPTVPRQAAPHSPTLDAVTVQQWREELEEFLTQTRQKLQALSNSLNDSQRHVQETNVQEVPAITATLPEAIITPTSEPPAANDDADPMDRLNAIKLRLAKQIEDAS